MRFTGEKTQECWFSSCRRHAWVGALSIGRFKVDIWEIDRLYGSGRLERIGDFFCFWNFSLPAHFGWREFYLWDCKDGKILTMAIFSASGSAAVPIALCYTVSFERSPSSVVELLIISRYSVENSSSQQPSQHFLKPDEQPYIKPSFPYSSCGILM